MKSKSYRYISAFLIVCIMLLLTACNGKNTERQKEATVQKITDSTPAAETTAIPSPTALPTAAETTAIPSPTVPLTPTETPAPKTTSGPLADLFVGWDGKAEGSIVSFGTYEQDNDETNGKEPIEWIVLEKQDNRFILISRLGLDCQPYHDMDDDVSWENSSLREWLNNEFREEAFSDVEEKFLMDYYLDGVNDKVVLLSSEEAEFFLNKVSFAQCTATAYAMNNGAGTSSKNNGNCWWWLRSMGKNAKYAAYMGSAGEVYDIGDPVTSDNDTVRPVICLQAGERVTESPEPSDAISVPKPTPISSNWNELLTDYRMPVINKEVLFERKDCPTVGVQKPSAKGLEYKKQADAGSSIYSIERKNALSVTYIKNGVEVQDTPYYYQRDYSNRYAQISGLKNKEIENAINQRIRDVFEALTDPGFYPKQRGIAEHIRRPDVRTEVSCMVEYNCSNLLSVSFSYKMYLDKVSKDKCVHRYYYPLNFNLENGKELCLADLVPEGEEFLPILSELVYERCLENPIWDLSHDNEICEIYGWTYEEAREFVKPPVYDKEVEYDDSSRTAFRGIDANQKFVLTSLGYGIELLFDSDTPGMEWAEDSIVWDDYAEWGSFRDIYYATKRTPFSILSVAQYDDIFENDECE